LKRLAATRSELNSIVVRPTLIARNYVGRTTDYHGNQLPRLLPGAVNILCAVICKKLPFNISGTEMIQSPVQCCDGEGALRYENPDSTWTKIRHDKRIEER
jgi:hypothetical protein